MWVFGSFSASAAVADSFISDASARSVVGFDCNTSITSDRAIASIVRANSATSTNLDNSVTPALSDVSATVSNCGTLGRSIASINSGDSFIYEDVADYIANVKVDSPPSIEVTTSPTPAAVTATQSVPPTANTIPIGSATTPAPQKQEQKQEKELEPIRNINIDFITVTGKRPLSDIGIQKTVFSDTELREDVAFSIADMLSHSSPVFIKSYGRGTMATASLRGTGSSHTRVTWNGMRMNSPLFGMMDLSYIPSYFIDGASLYYGASSVGVTGGGLGGAIALDTKAAAEQGFGMKYIQGAASFKTFDEYLKLSYGGQKVKSETSVLLTTSENDFRYRNYAKKEFVLDESGNVTGWSYPVERNRNCGYRDFHILQELYYDAGKGGNFGLSAWYMDSSRGLPLLNTDYTELNSSRSLQQEKTFRSVIRWDKYAGKSKLSAKAGYHYSDMHYTERSVRQYSENAPEEVQVRTDWRSFITTLFGDFSWERSFGEKFYLVADISVLQHFVYTVNGQPVRNTAEPSAYDDARMELSGVVSARYRPVERFGIALNLRQEVIGNEGAPFIPSLLLDWTVGRKGNVVLKASVARNYRFPSLNDNHFAKKRLLPEDGFTYDGGIELRGDTGRFTYNASVTFYDSYVSNWIFWYPDKGATQWLPANIKMVHAYGAEAAANMEYGWDNGLKAHFNGIFSWTRSINMRDPISGSDNAIGKQLPYIPVWSGAFTAGLSWRSWTVSYKWDYYSERFTTTDNSALITGKIVPYFMNSISAGKNFNFRWADIGLSVKVNNIFNEEYETELSRPMPGRNYGFSLEITPKFGQSKRSAKR